MHLEFRILEIPVRIRVWFLMMAFALGILHPSVGQSAARLLVWIAVLTVAVLAHELGHAVTGKSYGWAPRIELGFVGGVTFFERRSQVSRARRMLLVALGPLVGAMLGAMALAVLQFSPPPKQSLAFFALDATMLVNLVWGVLNLIPILPLDGGHLVAELASAVSPGRGRRFAMWFSLVVALGFAVLASFQKAWTFALVGVLFAWRNHRMLENERRGYDPASGIRARDLAYVALTRSDAQAVIEFGRRARDEARTNEETDEATYLLAWGHFLASDAGEARRVLSEMGTTRDRDFALEGAIAHDLGELEESLALFERALPRATTFVEPRMIHAIVETRRFEDAATLFDDELGAKFSPRSIAKVQRAAFDAGADGPTVEIGRSLFRRTHDGSVAFLVACAYSRLGQVRDGLAWLGEARDRGFARAEALDAEPALEALRATPEWPELRASFGRRD